MAKQTKSGLGRGLGALLGGPEIDTTAVEYAPVKERVVVDSELPHRSTEVKPAAAKAVVQKAPAAPVQTQNDDEQEVAQDKVTIKGVVERRLDEVPIDSVSPNPDQPRTNFKKEELSELSQSIEKDGLLQPILVRALPGNKYQIIAGERRWQACKLIGLKTVPVRIKEASDDKALELALIENVQRSDLNPIEEAYGYRRLMERCNMTQAEVAQAMSKGRSTVANALRLLELPEEAQQLLFEEKITAGHARAILSIPSMKGRLKLTTKLMEEKLTVREAEAIARLLSGKKSSSEKSQRQPTPQSFKKVAKALRESLHTNVRVKSVKGKNKIEIEFKDEEDLARLLEELTSFKE